MPAEYPWKPTIRAMARVARPHWLEIGLALVFGTTSMVLELCIPLTFKRIVDAIAVADTPAWEAVREPFILLAGIMCATWLVYRFQSVFMTRAAAFLSQRAKDEVFSRVSVQSAQLFSDVPSGKLLSLVQDFSGAMTTFLEFGLYQIMPTVLFVSWFGFTLARRSPILAVAFVIYVAATVTYQYRFAKRWRAWRELIVEKRVQATACLADTTGNMMTVKAFARERQESDGIRRANRAVTDAEFASLLREEAAWGIQNGLMVAIEIVLIGGMLYRWSIGLNTVGDVVLIQGYIVFLFNNLQGLTRIFRRLPAVLADASPAARLLNGEPDIVDVPEAKPLRVLAGAISFVGVHFGYKDGQQVLRGLSLDIKPGEKVALVGPSGAGKSTVVKLLYRFYDPGAGRVLIDGQDISKVTQESLRRSLALVPQDPVLFHRSLFENLRYADPKAKTAEVVAAAKRAHCAEFIKDLPKGYDSLVGDRGVKLSGGERQRVAIARALIADAPILVLDEATSSLDSASEALIKEALHEAMRDKTVIVIAHRLSTIMEMDRIVVMEHGKIVDQGTHAELIRREGKYKQLWDLQSGGYLPEIED